MTPALLDVQWGSAPATSSQQHHQLQQPSQVLAALQDQLAQKQRQSGEQAHASCSEQAAAAAGGCREHDCEAQQLLSEDQWHRARAADQVAWERQQAQQQRDWLMMQSRRQRDFELQMARDQQRWEQHRQLQQALWERWQQRQCSEWGVQSTQSGAKRKRAAVEDEAHSRPWPADTPHSHVEGEHLMLGGAAAFLRNLALPTEESQCGERAQHAATHDAGLLSPRTTAVSSSCMQPVSARCAAPSCGQDPGQHCQQKPRLEQSQEASHCTQVPLPLPLLLAQQERQAHRRWPASSSQRSAAAAAAAAAEKQQWCEVARQVLSQLGGQQRLSGTQLQGLKEVQQLLAAQQQGSWEAVSVPEPALPESSADVITAAHAAAADDWWIDSLLE